MGQPEMTEASPRPSLDDGAGRISLSDRNPNVFDDEYAVPSSASVSSVSTTSQDNDSPTASPTDQQREPNLLDRPDTPEPDATSSEPTSTLSHQNGNRIALPRKPIAATGTARYPGRSPSVVSNSTTSDDTVVPNRTMSSASSFNFARSQSPFQGASGPSHPYTMYPQSLGLARSSSVTTSSTARPLSINTPGGPSHPYTLYSQNVFADNEDNSEGYQQSIPLGFTSHSQTFHRRIGPEGEELDIVGPDGHTEQLPPYTKYPETFAMRSSPATRMPAIGETPTLEQLHSQETLVSPSSRTTGNTLGDSEASPSTVLTPSDNSNPTEKSWRQKTWKERRRTRVCGCVPMWLVWTLVGIIVILSIIIGACVGYYRATGYWPYKSSSDNDDKPQPTVTVTKTKLIGAIPTKTPSNMHVPTGTFGVPFSSPVGVSAGCLTHDHQSNAWSCDFVGPQIDITVTWPPFYEAPTCVAAIGVPGVFDYYNTGALPPNIQNQVLTMAEDPDDRASGPAFYFETYYDKVVVVPQDELTATAFGKRASSGQNAAGSTMRERPQLVSGETYWYCEWNRTFISGFIYINQPITPAEMSSAMPFPSKTPSPQPSSGPGQYPGSTPPASGVVADPQSTTGLHALSVQTNVAYPRRIKLAERRVPGSPSGVCTLKKFMDNGSLEPYPEGLPKHVILQEQDVPLPPPRTSRHGWPNTYARACHCEWDWG